MKIVIYPHPTLRYKSKPIKRVDRPLRNIVRNMFDLMYEARGVGLAANQVDLPLRLFVVNLQADPEEGEELVFVNPVVSRPKGTAEHEEGCLSFPGLQCQVKRPETVWLNSFNLEGKEFDGEVDGFLARVIQHELDHLDGVLFIDRLSATGQMAAEETIEEFQLAFDGQRERREIETDPEILSRLGKWEEEYC